MFAGAVAPAALAQLLIRYYLATEAIKFATGTERKDWMKMSLDISEQIGNIYTARLRQGELMGDPRTDPLGVLYGELVTGAAGLLGAPGTVAETLGYTFPGAAAKQRGRLEAEVTGGFPFTRERIKGAPAFAKRKVSDWNKQVKAGMKLAKAHPKLWRPGSAGLYGKGKKNGIMGRITKDLSKLNKGKKATTKQQKKLKAKLKGSISKAITDWKKRKGGKK